MPTTQLASAAPRAPERTRATFMSMVGARGLCRAQRHARLLASFVVTFATLFAVSPRANAAEPGEALTISLLTMGPGEHPFTKFGHTALLVHDGATGRDEVFNYGTFAFDSSSLLLDSVQGKLPYWLSVQSLRGTIAGYGEQGRSLLASELELTPAQRLALVTALRDNALPEHRYYRYDYYRDNCATRIRDALDRVLAGAVHAHGNEPARMSYRDHTLRLVASDPKLYVGLDLAVGRQTDAPITLWDEAFLPERLHDLFAKTTVAQNGKSLPLIRSEHTLLASELPAPRETAPSFFGFYLGVGLFLGAALTLLGKEARTSKRAQWALATLAIVLAVPLGLLGCAITYLTFFSAHSAAASNYNVLLLPPWILALPVAIVARWRGRAWSMRLARLTVSSSFATTALALTIRVCLPHAQATGQMLAFALPLWFGAFVALRSVEQRAFLFFRKTEPAPTATTRVTPKISG